MKHPKKELEQLGVRAKKRFGQNFLTSMHWAKKLVSALTCEKPLDEIWEIGPGLGALTELLIEDGKKILLFEVDRDFAAFHRSKHSGKNIEVIEGDVLKEDFQKLLIGAKQVGLISNLPYNISSQLLFKVIELREFFPVLVLTFQKEFADRLLALPSTKDYGSLSVIFQSFYDMEKIGTLSKECFYPKPEISSTALRFIPKKSPAVDLETFSEFVKTAFAHRRKTLVNNLGKKMGVEKLRRQLEGLALRPDIRPEAVSVEMFQSLFHS